MFIVGTIIISKKSFFCYYFKSQKVKETENLSKPHSDVPYLDGLIFHRGATVPPGLCAYGVLTVEYHLVQV